MSSYEGTLEVQRKAFGEDMPGCWTVCTRTQILYLAELPHSCYSDSLLSEKNNGTFLGLNASPSSRTSRCPPIHAHPGHLRPTHQFAPPPAAVFKCYYAPMAFTSQIRHANWEAGMRRAGGSIFGAARRAPAGAAAGGGAAPARAMTGTQQQPVLNKQDNTTDRRRL